MSTPVPKLAALLIALAQCSLVACGGRALLSELSPSEAERCSVVLRSAGLDVTVERDDSGGDAGRRLTLRGDEADYRTALRVLEEHNLPHRTAPGFSTETSALIPTATEERARFIKGLSGEIEAMIESVDGVVAAEALVSIPERRALAGPETEAASASVVVSHTGATPPISTDEIRALVVQCVGSALSADHVTVLLKPIVRPDTAAPIVRYQRDHMVELGFLGCVTCLGAMELVTLFYLRRERGRVRILEATGDDRSA
ncbi:MAG TPA: hypothetical protein PLF26_01660 [Blastocatellia bacterium]|nr:hypothetical protein [Blastocatellia bacterium]